MWPGSAKSETVLRVLPATAPRSIRVGCDSHKPARIVPAPLAQVVRAPRTSRIRATDFETCRGRQDTEDTRCLFAFANSDKVATPALALHTADLVRSTSYVAAEVSSEPRAAELRCRSDRPVGWHHSSRGKRLSARSRTARDGESAWTPRAEKQRQMTPQ